MQLHFGFCTVTVAVAVAVGAGARVTLSLSAALSFLSGLPSSRAGYAAFDAEPCGAEATAPTLTAGGGGGASAAAVVAGSCCGGGAAVGASLRAQPAITSARARAMRKGFTPSE